MQNNIAFKCYLCGGVNYFLRPGHARDDESLVPLECTNCGLVSLSSSTHIDDNFYRNSQMHNNQHCDPELMLIQGREDSLRRYHQFEALIKGKRILDVGCGSGGFLMEARKIAFSVFGVEPEEKLFPFFCDKQLDVYPSLEKIPTNYEPDVVTLFHVLEHIKNPLEMLTSIRSRFFSKEKKDKRLVIEVPSASDALLTVFKNPAFSKFTYWSCHLFLFTEDNLKNLAEKAGFKTVEMIQYQRYPIANHLYWLSEGKPGGQHKLNLFNEPKLQAEYENILKKNKLCDTVIGIFF